MDLLEYTGSTITDDDQIICQVKPSLCERSYQLQNLEDSPSIDLSKSDPEKWPLLLNFPQGTSTKNLIHMGQFYIQKKFQKFDYGPTVNQQKYGQPSPPEIDITKIQTPVGLFIGRHDYVADVQDNEEVRDLLPNVAEFKIFEN